MHGLHGGLQIAALIRAVSSSLIAVLTLRKVQHMWILQGTPLRPPHWPRPSDVSATRPRLRAEERRQAVLDTACQVFSKSSYRGATTAEIAREAGITEPILYRHFGSKRDLYLACLDQAWESFREFAEEAERVNPTGCLGAIADMYMAQRARVRLVDLWIQAISEASDDATIAKAVASS